MVNEGDLRDYDNFLEEVWVGDEEYVFDFEVFEVDVIKDEVVLGCLKVIIIEGDIDGDGDYD